MSGWFVLLCRLAIGGVFVFASLDKLVNPTAFAESIHHYRIVPYSLLHLAALLLPMVEFVLGIALITGIWRRGASLIATVLMVVFMVAIASALSRNLDISCGCFNTDAGHQVGYSLLWRDLGFLLLCLPPLLFRNGGPNLLRRRS
ncbi:MAG: putative membrane protein YphA (DoxX/SURF4 family) [Candidatus Krumholzibacteriia bacterium]|jgi:uncharacterized membrane protein YphA (DoxX/SURF4 family)